MVNLSEIYLNESYPTGVRNEGGGGQGHFWTMSKRKQLFFGMTSLIVGDVTECVPELLRFVLGEDGELGVSHAVPKDQYLRRPLVVDLVELLDCFDEGGLQCIYELLVTGLEASGAVPT